MSWLLTSTNKNPGQTAQTLKEAVEQVEERMIAEALEVNNGNRSLVAKCLGLSRQGLLNKMYKFGLADR